MQGLVATIGQNGQKECVAVLTMLYKKNGAVSCVGYEGSGPPLIPNWTRFGFGQISIKTATRSFMFYSNTPDY